MSFEVLLLTPEPTRNYDFLIFQLRSVVRSELSFVRVAETGDIARFYESKKDLGLLCVDVSESGFSDSVPEDFRELFGLVAKLSNLASIVVLTQKPLSTEELTEWMNVGATTALPMRFKASQLSDGLRALVARRLRYNEKKPRVLCNCEIVVEVKKNDKRISSETFDLGFGGLFMRGEFAYLELKDRVTFKLKVPSRKESQEPEIVRGVAKVVWLRKKNEYGLPPGVGLEFLRVKQDGQTVIEKHVRYLRRATFSPFLDES